MAVTDPVLREGLAGCGDFTSWLGTAPAVLVFVVPVDGGRLFDIGRMAQNAMVAGHAAGLASCPVTFHHQDRLRPLLGVPDDRLQPPDDPVTEQQEPAQQPVGWGRSARALVEPLVGGGAAAALRCGRRGAVGGHLAERTPSGGSTGTVSSAISSPGSRPAMNRSEMLSPVIAE